MAFTLTLIIEKAIKQWIALLLTVQIEAQHISQMRAILINFSFSKHFWPEWKSCWFADFFLIPSSSLTFLQWMRCACVYWLLWQKIIIFLFVYFVEETSTSIETKNPRNLFYFFIQINFSCRDLCWDLLTIDWDLKLSITYFSESALQESY